MLVTGSRYKYKWKLNDLSKLAVVWRRRERCHLIRNMNSQSIELFYNVMKQRDL